MNLLNRRMSPNPKSRPNISPRGPDAPTSSHGETRTFWILSDIHLTSCCEENRWKLLLAALHHFSSVCQDHQNHEIIFLGDIFDLWVGSSSFFHQKYQPIVDEILKLHQLGVSITFIEGNHDFHMKRFWRRHGIRVHSSAYTVNSKTFLLHVEHGDLINQKDLAYLRYRKVVRSWPFQMIACFLGGYLMNRIGERLSRYSRGRSHGNPSEAKTYKHGLQNPLLLKEWTQSYIKDLIPLLYPEAVLPSSNEPPLPLLFVAGHFHLYQDWTFPVFQTFGAADELKSGTKPPFVEVHSINLGSWMDAPCILEVRDSQTFLHQPKRQEEREGELWTLFKYKNASR